MTIPAAADNRATATGNGVTTSFAYNYAFTAAADLIVLVNGVTMVLNSDYTLSGSIDSVGRYLSGANVVFSVAPANLASVVIYADPVVQQTLDLVANDPLPAESVEKGLDVLTLMVRRLKSLVSRSLVLSDADISSTTLTLPTPAANKVLAFNSTATALVALDIGSASLQTPADGSVTPAKLAAGTRGDVLVAGVAGVWAKLGIGTNKRVLTSNGTDVSWTDSIANVLTTTGDTLYASAANTPARLAAGTGLQQLRMNAGATAPEWFTATSGITLGTPVPSTSGTSIDFTGLPAGVKRVTISFVGVSTNGTSSLCVQIGPSGGIETSSYLSAAQHTGTGPTQSTISFIGIDTSEAAASVIGGVMVLTLENSSNNTWSAFSTLYDSNVGLIATSAGTKAIAGALSKVRITTLGGANTFDAGEINIAYET